MSEPQTEPAWRIRPCEPRDLDAARAICEETSSIPLRDRRDRQFLLLVYCDYYVLYASDCFVAVDASDRPVGYLFCAADNRLYLRAFRRHILPQIDRLGLKYALFARGVLVGHALFAVFAPAHLHIDLTASARRQGIGTALIRTLKARLAAQGIPRVRLTCGSSNKNAIRFYQRNAFRTVLKGFGETLMVAETGPEA